MVRVWARFSHSPTSEPKKKKQEGLKRHSASEKPIPHHRLAPPSVELPYSHPLSTAKHRSLRLEVRPRRLPQPTPLSLPQELPPLPSLPARTPSQPQHDKDFSPSPKTAVRIDGASSNLHARSHGKTQPSDMEQVSRFPTSCISRANFFGLLEKPTLRRVFFVNPCGIRGLGVCWFFQHVMLITTPGGHNGFGEPGRPPTDITEKQDGPKQCVRGTPPAPADPLQRSPRSAGPPRTELPPWICAHTKRFPPRLSWLVCSGAPTGDRPDCAGSDADCTRCGVHPRRCRASPARRPAD